MPSYLHYKSSLYFRFNGKETEPTFEHWTILSDDKCQEAESIGIYPCTNIISSKASWFSLFFLESAPVHSEEEFRNLLGSMYIEAWQSKQNGRVGERIANYCCISDSDSFGTNIHGWQWYGFGPLYQIGQWTEFSIKGIPRKLVDFCEKISISFYDPDTDLCGAKGIKLEKRFDVHDEKLIHNPRYQDEEKCFGFRRIGYNKYETVTG